MLESLVLGIPVLVIPVGRMVETVQPFAFECVVKDSSTAEIKLCRTISYESRSLCLTLIYAAKMRSGISRGIVLRD
jgi:hypothetical protein